MKLSKIKELRFETKLLNLMNQTGFQKSLVENIEVKFADRVPEEGEDYYYYSGPDDDKTRDFCKLMLNIDKVFSSDQIDYISNELNYDVLKYKGSYNCRHKWVKFRGKRISTPNPTTRQIRQLINNGIEG